MEEPRAVLLQGNEAVARGALYAGLSFFAGYPITPSTEIAEFLSGALPGEGGVFIQMEDEMASLGACLGASLAGAKVMTATSGPGFSLMQELIGYASAAEIPAVIVNVMRMGPSTGIPTYPSQGDVMQARWGTHGDHPIIALTASSVAECFEMTVKAFNFAEKYRVPVILLLDEVIGHMREKVTLPAPGELPVFKRIRPEVPPEWYEPYASTPSGVPPMSAFGDGYRPNVTGLIHDKLGMPVSDAETVKTSTDRLFDKIRRGFPEIFLSEEYLCEDASVVLLSYGVSARSAREAVDILRGEGEKAGLLTLKTLWPFPRAALERAAKTASRVVVCEMNRGQIYREALRVGRGRWETGKALAPYGELMPPEVIARTVRGYIK